MKNKLICLLSLVGLTAFGTPYQQNSYDTANNASVDAHVVGLAQNVVATNVPVTATAAVTATNAPSGAGVADTNFVSTNATAMAQTVVSNYIPLNSTNFDLPTWKIYQASHLVDYNNLGRFAWPYALTNLRVGTNLTLEIDGTGFIAWLRLGIITNFLPQAPIAGFATALYPWVYGLGSGGGAVWDNGKDAWTYGGATYLPTNGAYATYVGGTTNFFWNVFGFTLSKWTNGGTVLIKTNNGSGGAYTTVITTNLSALGTNAVTIYWTNPIALSTYSSPAQLPGLEVMNSGTGTNWILNYCAFNTNITNGIIFGSMYNDSASLYQIMLPMTNFSYPIYQAINPQLILVQTIEGAAGDTTNVPNLINFYRAVCPAANEVFCGVYPFPSDAGTGDTSATNQNAAMRAVCISNNVAYFDAYNPFVSTNLMSKLGLLVGGDGTHLYAAFPVWAYFWCRWIDAQDYYYRGLQ